MKKYASTTLLSLLIPGLASAAIIKGRLYDSVNNEGIPFATVKAFYGNDTIKPVSVFATDVDGYFSQDIKNNGTYKITFESVGKNTLSKSVIVSNDETLDLGTLEMVDDVALINELEVVAVKSIVKASADKLSYSVEDDSDSKTYTLLDMLRKVPMVSVDGEDNISVNGSTSFQVYVNGKPSMLFSNNPSQIFKSMPASAVKSIEVVTNPGARYDAEGAGGVLNLIMDQDKKQDNDGYNGSVGIHGGIKGYDGNIYLSGQEGKFSYSINGMHSAVNPGDSKVTNSQIFPDRIITSHSNGDPKMKFTMGNITASYEIDSLTTIGISGAINGFNMKTPGNSFTNITTPQGTTLLDYSSVVNMKMGRLGTNGSLSLNRDFGDSRNSNLSVIYQVSYEHNKNDNCIDFSTENESFIDLSDRTIHSPATTLEHIVQADFSTKPGEGQTLEAGLKMALRKADSSSFSDFEDSEDSSSTKYKNHNNIGAAYAEYSLAANAFTGKAGLRYEYTWQDVDFLEGNGDSFSHHYGTFVPSASLSYSLSPASQLATTYNMRISRPGISYMNPFVDNSNPTSISYGNPNLDVEKTHNVGIAYNLFSRKLMLNVKLSDSYTKNGIEQYSFYEDELLNTTYGNIVKRNSIRLDAYVNWMAAENTRLIFNGSAGYTNIKSDALSLSNSGWNWNVMAGLQQTLPFNIKGAAYLIASSKSYTLEGWNSGFKMLALNISKTFLNDKLSLSAGFSTGLSKNGDMKIESVSHTPEFSTSNSIRVPMMNFNVGLSYSFGNFSQRKQRINKNIENDFMEHKSNMETLPGMMGN